MIKQFYSNNISSMTFVFSIVILMNSILDFLGIIDLGDITLFILCVALLIFSLSLIAHSLTYINFHSAKTYHIVNYGSQIIAFFLIAGSMGIIPLTIDGIITNAFAATGIYYLTGQRRKQQLNQLANAINEQLAEQ